MNTTSTGNTQRSRNREIQRLVRWIRSAYEDRIHCRFLELGVDDFIRREDGVLDWSASVPEPTPIANYVFDGFSPSPARTYHDVLADLHRLVCPDLYLEIGVESGQSLALAASTAIGIDPSPPVSAERVGTRPGTVPLPHDE